MGKYDTQVRQQLSRYKHKDLVQRDILNVFASFSDLKPKIDKYAFSDGSVKDLLCIDGTIPVDFKGAKCNIPVCIYVMDTHPYNPPMCFVRPTKDMLIKPSKNVDANGRIYLPCLHEWKFPNSDLIGLIQVMSVVFGEASPVYAKPQKASPPRPTYPPWGYPHPQQFNPYPTNSGFMPMPNASGQPQNSGYYPPQNPPTSSYQLSGYPYPVLAPGYPYNQSSSITPYPTNTQPQMTTAKPPPVKSQNSLSDDQVRASIQSAVEDKLKQTKEGLQQIKSEIAVLTETQNKLKQDQETLERMTNELEQQHAEVEQNTALLMRKNEEIKQVLNKMEGQQEIDIDEALSKYKHKDLAQRDILNVFASFSGLKPKSDEYAFNDGSVKDLLCIDGTIPVHYKGAKYNIPVCIYVMDTHPYNQPMCFVRPTKDMLIKPSKNVDANGRIYLPYLHEWKFSNSDLIGLIQVMSVVFGEASPVYAKPQRATAPRPVDSDSN